MYTLIINRSMPFFWHTYKIQNNDSNRNPKTRSRYNSAALQNGETALLLLLARDSLYLIVET